MRGKRPPAPPKTRPRYVREDLLRCGLPIDLSALTHDRNRKIAPTLPGLRVHDLCHPHAGTCYRAALPKVAREAQQFKIGTTLDPYVHVPAEHACVDRPY